SDYKKRGTPRQTREPVLRLEIEVAAFDLCSLILAGRKSTGRMVTDVGIALVGRIGIDCDPVMAHSGRRSARILCRGYLDWSERRPHTPGTIGAPSARMELRRIGSVASMARAPSRSGQRESACFVRSSACD